MSASGGMSVYRCSCGGVPKARVYRLAEDCMGAIAYCPACKKEGPEIEHVWGGSEARAWAFDEWNGMRQAESRKEDK